MTEKLKAIIIDASTGEVSEKFLSKKQIDERNQMLTDTLERQEQEKNKKEAKESALAKLSALGLTEEEIKAIIGS